MNKPDPQLTSFWKVIRDIIILPFTMTAVVPALINIFDRTSFIPYSILVKAIGIVFMVFGIGLFFYAVYLFWIIGKGTLAPWEKTKKLVIKGPYQYCRNPMITGVLFILIGESLLLSSILIFLWATIFFIINTLYFLYKEEPDMEKRFGDEYLEYKKNVPRWIPRLKSYTN